MQARQQLRQRRFVDRFSRGGFEEYHACICFNAHDRRPRIHMWLFDPAADVNGLACSFGTDPGVGILLPLGRLPKKVGLVRHHRLNFTLLNRHFGLLQFIDD